MLFEVGNCYLQYYGTNIFFNLKINPTKFSNILYIDVKKIKDCRCLWSGIDFHFEFKSNQIISRSAKDITCINEYVIRDDKLINSIFPSTTHILLVPRNIFLYFFISLGIYFSVAHVV